MLTLTESAPVAQMARQVLATRIVTPAQEQEINQALWQSNLSPSDAAIFEKLLQGLVNGHIVVLSELGRRQSISGSLAADHELSGFINHPHITGVSEQELQLP